MAGGAEELPLGADLDEPAGVHDGDAVGEHGDDGEVVAHVERRDPVELAELAHRLEDVRLRRHVEPGRGLVEDDDPGPAREGHREPDPLLLAPGQLMRVAPEKLTVVRKQHFAEHLLEP